MTKDADIKFGDVVALEWQDSQTQQGWINLREVRGAVGRVASCGLVVANLADGLTISTSYGGESPHFIDPITIPWSCIVAIRKLDATVEEY